MRVSATVALAPLERSLSLKSPYCFFLHSLLPPAPSTRVELPTRSSALVPETQWECTPAAKTYKDTPLVLKRFQSALSGLYRRKVAFPADESNLASLPLKEYLAALLQPVADLCNQLHSPRVLRMPMRSTSIELCDAIYGATFVAKGLERWKAAVPFVVSVPDDLFDHHGTVSRTTQLALSKVVEHQPNVLSIIATDFKEIAVFSPPTPHNTSSTYERISTTQPALALRILSAAYLVDRLPYNFLLRADPDYEVDTTLILPEGPPQDPNQCLPSDEALFATHRRTSDFDVATLIRDRRRASQFFRWHTQTQTRYRKLVARPGDVLSAATNETGHPCFTVEMRPVCPFDPSELPADTAQHIESVRRASPLSVAGLAEDLVRSEAFTLRVLDIVSAGSQRGLCTVYRCEITEVDGKPATSPVLCLKLFDDRFLPLERPEELEARIDTQHAETDPRWFDGLVLAEGYAVNEAAAYDKLRFVQGSVIPWFYGVHQFTLSDGTVLSGLLMEYIDGWPLTSECMQNMSAERQISVIRSCRHAVRTLDIADISQRDWHAGQMVVTTNPRTEVDHAVFIDFAMTTQTWEPDEVNFLDNYLSVLRILLGRERAVGVDPQRVWDHFGGPDVWELGVAYVPRPDGGHGRIAAEDMFPFITCA